MRNPVESLSPAPSCLNPCSPSAFTSWHPHPPAPAGLDDLTSTFCSACSGKGRGPCRP